MTAPGGEELPKIGPAAANAQIPIVGAKYVDPDWNRLTQIKIDGVGWAGTLDEVTVGASMSYSASQIGQMSLTVLDSWSGDLIGAGLVAKGTAIDWGDQHCVVTAISMKRGTGGPLITFSAQSRVIHRLTGKDHAGKGTWGEQDFSAWLIDRAREAGATWFIQPGLGVLPLSRMNDQETTWTTAQRGAQQVGAWCFEYENKIVCGRPTWLADTSRSRVWPLNYFSPDNYTNGLDGMPSFTWSDSGQESLSFGLLSGDADSIRPGERVTLGGNMGWATGDWIVTQVDLPGRISEAVSVTCGRIRDPEPQQTGAVSS